MFEVNKYVTFTCVKHMDKMGGGGEAAGGMGRQMWQPRVADLKRKKTEEQNKFLNEKLYILG
jgi:hypothetical protein